MADLALLLAGALAYLAAGLASLAPLRRWARPLAAVDAIACLFAYPLLRAAPLAGWEFFAFGMLLGAAIGLLALLLAGASQAEPARPARPPQRHRKGR